MPYLTLASGLARAKERCQQTETEDNDQYLTELLEMSAGKDANAAVHYRPFYCAARFLAQNPDLRDLSEATGEAKFTLAEPRIQDLMNLQYAYDLANGLAIPTGMEATVAGQAKKPPIAIPFATTSLNTTAVS